jgi:hypothetical protein
VESKHKIQFHNHFSPKHEYINLQSYLLYQPSACTQPNWCRQDLNFTCNLNTSTCRCATTGIYHYHWNGTQCVLCDCLTCQRRIFYELNPPVAYDCTYHSNTYTAFNTIATLAFGFRSDAMYYWLDDVNVNIIQNWNFEQGNIKWNYSNPYNPCL